MTKKAKMTELSKKRKLIGYWIFGILVLALSLIALLHKITHFSRSSHGDTVPVYEEQRLLKLKQENIGDYKESAHVSPTITVHNIGSYPSAIRTALTRKIIDKNGANKIEFNDIVKFDLSFPHSPEYKNDNEWSIFSKNDALDIEGYEAVRKAVTENNSQYVVTLSNRISGLKTDLPELVAILPKLRKESCEAAIRAANDLPSFETVYIPKLEEPPSLKPFDQYAEQEKIITFPENQKPHSGCVEAEGSYYYYQVIYEF